MTALMISKTCHLKLNLVRNMINAQHFLLNARTLMKAHYFHLVMWSEGFQGLLDENHREEMTPVLKFHNYDISEAYEDFTNKYTDWSLDKP